MKKKLFAIVSALTMATTCFSLTACKEKNLFDEYDFEPVTRPQLVQVDEGMTVDGKADEAEWKRNDLVWVEYTNVMKSDVVLKQEVKYKVTTHFGENGIYLFGICDDPVINPSINSTNRFATAKTAMAFTVCPEETPDGETSNYYGLEITAAANGEYCIQKQYRNTSILVHENIIKVATSVINGSINANGEGTADGYSAEVFVPWRLFGHTQKPEQIRMKFACIRHETPSDTERVYSSLDGANGIYHKTWLPFTKNGAPVIANNPEGYVIDGKDDDWVGYMGKTHYVDIYSVYQKKEEDGSYTLTDADGNPSTVSVPTPVDNDQRYVEYKLRKLEDGLLIHVEALQRLYSDFGGLSFRNTSIELRMLTRDGKLAQYFMQPSYVAAFHKGAFNCEETDETLALTGEKLKRITAEWFIPNYVLDFLGNIDMSGDSVKAAIVFRNGDYQTSHGDPEYHDLTMDTCEVIFAQFDGAPVPPNQPFIFFEKGSLAWYPAQLDTVDINGIQEK